MGCHVALGITDRGSREIIGFYLSELGTTKTWKESFNYLKQRDLSSPKYIEHPGLVQAVRQCFTG